MLSKIEFFVDGLGYIKEKERIIGGKWFSAIPHLFMASFFPRASLKLIKKHIESGGSYKGYYAKQISQVGLLLPLEVMEGEEESKIFLMSQLAPYLVKVKRKEFPNFYEALYVSFRILNYERLMIELRNLRSELELNSFNEELLSSKYIPLLYEALAIKQNASSKEVEHGAEQISIDFLKKILDLSKKGKSQVNNIEEQARKVSEERQLQALEDIRKVSESF